MNRNTIIGLVLIFGIFIGWSLLMRPSEEELEKQQRIQDSLALLQEKRLDSLTKAKILKEAERKVAAESAKKSKDIQQPVDTTLIKEKALENFGVFSLSSLGEDEYITLENDVLKISLSTKGGRIYQAELKDYQTYDSLPLILFDSDTSVFGLQFFAGNKAIFTDNLYFKAYVNGNPVEGNEEIIAQEGRPVDVSMRLFVDGQEGTYNRNKYIEYVYTVQPDNYMVGLDVNMVGMNDVISSSGNIIDLLWSANLRMQEKTIDRFNGSTIYYKYSDGDVDYMSETKDDYESLTDKIKWVSFKQHFFSSTIISDDFFVNPVMKTFTVPDPKSNRYLKSMEVTLGLPYNGVGNQAYKMDFYLGPLSYNVMRSYKLDLERQIPLGWSFFLMQWINRFAVIPVFNFLGSLGWNYGIIILVLTILLKIVLMPIAYKMYRSTAKMRVLKPEIDEISKKFPKKEDAMKKQQATMELYRKAGVNPMAGCVPMLLQLPILLAMFRFFPSSIELRQQPFLWATDLSSYDSIMDLPFNIPFYGSHVSLFTLLMTVSTIMYTRINNQMMGSSSTQMPGMKTMMYIMPVMFLGIFNNYASALSYYYLLANLITFGQMFVIRKTINEEKIYEKLQENKKKPKKKSGFQKRLEEAAKKRGYNPNQFQKKK